MTQDGHVSDYRVLGGTNGSKLLLSSNSFVDNSYYSILDIDQASPQPRVISSSSRNGSYFGLSQEQVSEIWFDGAEDHYRVHAWVIKPSNFDPQGIFPLAYLIHGGPQGSWEEIWSTRW